MMTGIMHLAHEGRRIRLKARLASRVKVPDTLGVAMLVLSLYLGLSPVYSISGVAGAELRLFKSAVIVAGVALVMIPPLIQRRLWLPTGALGPLAFLGLVILSVPGMVQSGDEALAFTFVADIAYGAVFAWCFFHLAREGLDVNIMLVRALVLLAALAAVSVAVAVSSVPDLMSLCEWDEPVHSIFGAHYTAWSMSLALFLPIAALLPSVIRSTAGTSGTLIGIVLAIILLGAQFISGGRAGIAASVLSVAALTLFRTSRIFALAVAAFILMAGVTLFDEQCSKHFRLERISALFAAGEGTPQTLNTLGTGRIEGYRTAMNGISERPLLGHGLGQFVVEGVHQPSVEIHSLWLKWAVYCGVLAPLWFAVMVGGTAYKGLRLLVARRQAPEKRATTAALLLVLACGIFASLVQPSALIGSFQYTAVWWAVVGILAGLYSREYGSGTFLVGRNPGWLRGTPKRLNRDRVWFFGERMRPAGKLGPVDIQVLPRAVH